MQSSLAGVPYVGSSGEGHRSRWGGRGRHEVQTEGEGSWGADRGGGGGGGGEI